MASELDYDEWLRLDMALWKDVSRSNMFPPVYIGVAVNPSSADVRARPDQVLEEPNLRPLLPRARGDWCRAGCRGRIPVTCRASRPFEGDFQGLNRPIHVTGINQARQT
jgi:hypothetical protein